MVVVAEYPKQPWPKCLSPAKNYVTIIMLASRVSVIQTVSDMDGQRACSAEYFEQMYEHMENLPSGQLPTTGL